MSTFPKELREQLLDFFRYGYSDRPNLRHRMRINWMDQSWICTTNAHAAVFIKDAADIEIDEAAKPVNIRGILPDQLYIGDQIPNELLNKLLAPPMITRKMRHTCEACDGNGKFDHHGEEYDCKSCNEKGYIEGYQMETIPDPDIYLKIAGGYLSMDRWIELKVCVKRFKDLSFHLMEDRSDTNKLFLKIGEEIILLLMTSINVKEKNIKVIDMGFGKEVSSEQ